MISPRRAACSAANGAVGDPDQDVDGDAGHLGDRPGQRVQHRRLAAEVAHRPLHADGGQPGPGDLDPGRDRFERGHDRLEQPGLGGLVAGQDDQFGAAGLGLAPAQAAARPRRRGPDGSRPPPGWRSATATGASVGQRRR